MDKLFVTTRLLQVGTQTFLVVSEVPSHEPGFDGRVVISHRIDGNEVAVLLVTRIENHIALPQQTSFPDPLVERVRIFAKACAPQHEGLFLTGTRCLPEFVHPAFQMVAEFLRYRRFVPFVKAQALVGEAKEIVRDSKIQLQRVEWRDVPGRDLCSPLSLQFLHDLVDICIPSKDGNADKGCDHCNPPNRLEFHSCTLH